MSKKRMSLGLNGGGINLFYLPAILLFVMFVIYPFIQGGFLSLTNWNGYSQTYKIVGLKNYLRLFTDENVRTALINTLIYAFGSCTGTTYLRNAG